MKVLLMLVLTTSAVAGTSAASLQSALKEEVEREVETRSIDDCVVNGFYFTNGQVFSIPGHSHCIKYRCVRGSWDPVEEACEVGNRCYPVGLRFVHDCTTYHCQKIDRGTHLLYQPVSLSVQCKDFQGNCHQPGNSFPYSIRGRYYEHCTCAADHQSVRYSCRSG